MVSAEQNCSEPRPIVAGGLVQVRQQRQQVSFPSMPGVTQQQPSASEAPGLPENLVRDWVSEDVSAARAAGAAIQSWGRDRPVVANSLESTPALPPALALKTSSPFSRTCAPFAEWPHLDDNVTCGAGSCMALVLTERHGHRCDSYCDSFQHVCTAAYEEENDTCVVKETRDCGKEYADTSDMICKCEFPGVTPSPTPVPEPAGISCADFSQWPDVDRGVTCGEGSCTALVKSERNGGRCDVYCASFGHTCLAAFEEVDENCQIKATYRCDEAIKRTSDILCTCASGGGPAPTPAPAPGGAECADFALWPDVDGVTCGSCTALVLSAKYGGRCDAYCESFGHECLAAFEEENENCQKKATYRCDEAIKGTSDILCTCTQGGGTVPSPGPGPAPLPPGGVTCAEFTFWPDVDGVTCGSCTALVLSAKYGGRCDAYCESFGHKCLAAFEEENENCQKKATYRCDEAIKGTSDILCTCTGSGAPPPAPPAPSGSTLVTTPCVSLMLVGDYGSRTSTQERVAAGMAKVAQQRSPAVIAGVGDNIYGKGAEGQPEVIVRWWKDIYLRHESLRRPWHIVTGNHDWYTDARVERDFTTHPANVGGHWRMPGFWYKHTFRSSTSGLTVDTFWIDTQVWKGSSVVSRYIGSQAAREQKLWLEEALGNSTADWKILFGHHPVYSRGSHGVTQELFQELDPMMRRHGVQAMVCGHDHSKHLIQFEGLSYVVNGAGGKSPRTPSNEYPSGRLIADHQNPGFATLRLCKGTPGQLEFFDKDGGSQSSSPIPAEAPTAGLSGSVRLANGRTLQLVGGAAGLSVPGPEQRCGDRVMREVDKFCPSADGSGCRVIADESATLTCEHYCREVNGLACRGGWEQEDEDCQPAAELGCHEARGSIDALICECGPDE